MIAKKVIAPELLQEARRLYEGTVAPVVDICGMLGIRRDAFYVIVRESGWRKRRARVATFEFSKVLGAAAAATLAQNQQPGEPRAAPLETLAPLSPEQRLALAERLISATEQALGAITRITAQLNPTGQSEANDTARTMANVTRSLREIAALIKPDEVKTPDDTDDDPVPRDIDQFRNELARRIRGFIALRQAGDGGVLAVAEGEVD